MLNVYVSLVPQEFDLTNSRLISIVFYSIDYRWVNPSSDKT